jgi:hypothetical protein
MSNSSVSDSADSAQWDHLSDQSQDAQHDQRAATAVAWPWPDDAGLDASQASAGNDTVLLYCPECLGECDASTTQITCPACGAAFEDKSAAPGPLAVLLACTFQEPGDASADSESLQTAMAVTSIRGQLIYAAEQQTRALIDAATEPVAAAGAAAPGQEVKVGYLLDDRVRAYALQTASDGTRLFRTEEEWGGGTTVMKLATPEKRRALDAQLRLCAAGPSTPQTLSALGKLLHRAHCMPLGLTWTRIAGAAPDMDQLSCTGLAQLLSTDSTDIDNNTSMTITLRMLRELGVPRLSYNMFITDSRGHVFQLVGWAERHTHGRVS